MTALALGGLLAQQANNVQVVTYEPNPIFGVIGLLIGLAVSAAICYLLYNAQNAIPPEHQRVKPGMIWLLMIPLFNLVWNFFTFPKISDSYASYFQSRGRTDVGDAGRGIGLAFAICAACSIIPCVGVFTALASLVLLILFLVKIYGLKSQIGQVQPTGFPAGPGTMPPPPPPGQM
jgi:hypothetical protein